MQRQAANQEVIVRELFGASTRCFDSYLKVYDRLLARGDFYALQIEEPGPEDSIPLSHDDILIGARVIRKDPTLTLDQAIAELARSLRETHSRQQLKFVILVVIRAMIMLDCARSERPKECWQPNQRCIDFVTQSFPRTAVIPSQVFQALAEKSIMKAWKLRKRFGVSFKSTDDLARHLFLDPGGPTVYIFHHTTFLKAQLDRLKNESFGIDEDTLRYLQIGCLPPRLIAETLHSVQHVLFHFDDQRSSKILERLIAKGGFDEDCSQPEGYAMFDDAENLPYFYWGERLATLHEFVLGRPPRNRFERWMKWQTSESNALFVALAALLISIIVGLLTLGLSGFQAWVAWKAWKEPVSDDSETTILLQEIVDMLRQHRR